MIQLLFLVKLQVVLIQTDSHHISLLRSYLFKYYRFILQLLLQTDLLHRIHQYLIEVLLKVNHLFHLINQYYVHQIDLTTLRDAKDFRFAPLHSVIFLVTSGYRFPNL